MLWTNSYMYLILNIILYIIVCILTYCIYYIPIFNEALVVVLLPFFIFINVFNSEDKLLIY